jgi:signal transduction histidine kinase
LLSQKQVLVIREEARLKNEGMRLLNYTIGHDLKAPILHFKLFMNRLEVLFSKQFHPEFNLLLDQMTKTIGNIEGIVNGVLNYIEQDEIPLHFSKIDLNQMIVPIIQSIQMVHEKQPIVFEVAENLPQVEGDVFMLRQVFTNLIHNAVKFSEDQIPCLISITSSYETPFVIIHVNDNGTGFPKGSAEQIFGLFKRAHDHSKYPGDGVGLAIVKKIVERHQGKVSAKNNPNGKGATFSVFLPIQAKKEAK